MAEPVLTSFGFHGAASFHLYSDDPEAISFFNAEYAAHKETTVVEKVPSVTLRFTREDGTLPELAGFIYHSHKVLARWLYRMEIQDNRILIEVVGNSWSIPMVHHMLIHPSLRYLCTLRQVAMLHSGAVVKGGKSLIFTGHGGAGKTTITSLVLAFGGPDWALHADDYTFLSPGPRSMAYLTRSHLYSGLLQWVPQINDLLTPQERSRLKALGLLRAWSGEHIKWPVRLAPERLWPNRKRVMAALPVGILFLSREDVSAPQVVPLAFSEERLNELMEMNFFEARHFLTLAAKALPADVYEPWLAGWRERETRLIRSVLNETPLYRLMLPKSRQNTAEFRQSLAAVLNQLVDAA